MNTFTFYGGPDPVSCRIARALEKWGDRDSSQCYLARVLEERERVCKDLSRVK